MKKTVVVAFLKARKGSAVKFQKILTQYGCIIKTRLGIHDGVMDKCSDTGLIILELAGEEKQKSAFVRKLITLKGVVVKKVDLALRGV